MRAMKPEGGFDRSGRAFGSMIRSMDGRCDGMISTRLAGAVVILTLTAGPASGQTLVSSADGLAPCLAKVAGHPTTGSDFEPQAAADPKNPAHLVATWMTVAANDHVNIRVASSTDGGGTWTKPVTLPFTQCAGGPDSATYSVDTWVSIGADGRAYISALAAIGPPDPPA